MARIIRIFLTSSPIFIIANFYVAWRFLGSLSQVPVWPQANLKLIVLSVFGALNLYPVLLIICHAAGFRKITRAAAEGNRFWDIPLGYPFWANVIFVVEVIPWLLAIDFLKLPFYPFYDKYRSVWLDTQALVVLSIFAVYSVYVVLKIIIDTLRIRVSESSLVFRNIPASMHDLHIVHISDIQAGRRTGIRRMNRYVRKVNKLNPDVILFTGDVVASEDKYGKIAASVLGRLKSKYGVYGCLGDHDTQIDTDTLVDSLEDNHFRLIDNKNHFISVGASNLLVTFMTNTPARKARHDTVDSLMGHQPRGTLDVLVTHQPSETIVEMASERGYHLLLAGHTHGGQVVLKPFGFSLAQARLESPYCSGKYYIRKMLLNINNGLGFNVLPVRYHAPAEISVIRIIKRS